MYEETVEFWQRDIVDTHSHDIYFTHSPAMVRVSINFKGDFRMNAFEEAKQIFADAIERAEDQLKENIFKLSDEKNNSYIPICGNCGQDMPRNHEDLNKSGV